MLANFNLAVFNFIFRFAHRSFLLDSFGVFLAEYLPYFLGLGVLLFIFSEKNGRRRWFYLAEMALALILSRGILTELIRHFYYHPRPFDALGVVNLIAESGASFPSGHAAFFFAMAGILLFWDKRWGWTYLGFAALNGLARVFAGVHWPLDILGGALVGLVSAAAVHLLVRKYFPANSSAESAVTR